jgi:hypothetical protein
MIMKRTHIQNIAISTFVVVLAGIAWYTLYGSDNTPRLATYSNPAYGISFTYPKEYALTETPLTGNASGTMVVITDAKGKLPENGEGPTAITIGMYDDAAPEPGKANVSATSWILESPDSNFKLSKMTEPGLTQIAGQDAYLYTWDGLYQGTTVAMTHAQHMLVFTVTYDGETDLEKRDAFGKLLESLQFTEPNTADGGSI